jgi:DNA polymerase-3 subunit delta'
MSFAKALCCPNRPPAQPVACGVCSVCRRIDREVFPDVVEFSLDRQAQREGNKSRNLTLNVATVREVAAAVAYRPAEAAWKIVVVRDAETMQETAQEAFLKTLEEPPSYAVILLLVDDLEPILPTIQSRCTVVRFGQVNRAEVARALSAAGVPDPQSAAISEIAKGSIGWALQAAGDGEMLAARQRELDEARTWAAGTAYDRLVTSIRLADEFARNREATLGLLALVQEVWRGRLEVLLGLHQEHSDLARAAEVVGAIRSIDRCIASLEANVRPRLAMEAMVADWPSPF